MLDELRESDWMSRSRAKARKTLSTHCTVWSKTGRSPLESEIAAEMELSPG